MDRELLIQNIRLNYSRYGVTEEVIKEEIEPLIDDSIRKGRSYDFIYFVLQLAICEEYGLEYFWCTERQMARAFGISDEKMLDMLNRIQSLEKEKKTITGILLIFLGICCYLISSTLGGSDVKDFFSGVLVGLSIGEMLTGVYIVTKSMAKEQK